MWTQLPSNVIDGPTTLFTDVYKIKSSAHFESITHPGIFFIFWQIAKLESTVSREASLNWDSENTVGCRSIVSIPSDHTPTPKVQYYIIM